MVHAARSEGHPTAAPIYIGCAGWGLSAMVATRFPTQGSHLERYAQVFSAVEINSSFYRPHQPKTYARWAASVPDVFRFSVKIPRRISHELKLRDAETATDEFVRQIMPLGEKLGCLLLQLPPSLALDERIARHFFSLLKRLTTARIVCEPRHATWFSAAGVAILKNAGVAYVQADPPPIAGTLPVSDPHMLYIRLHGSPEIYYSAYDEPFIEALRMRIIEARHSNTAAWCMFDNTARGEAVPNALTLVEKLGKHSAG